MVIGLTIGQNATAISEANSGPLPRDFQQEISAKETNLHLNKNLAEYINTQAELDGADQVIFIADSVLVTQKVTLKEVDLIIVSNYFSTDGNQVEILPAPTNKKQSGISGKNGKEVQIISKYIDEAQFHLPGMDGTDGSDGSNGKSGKKNEVKKHGDVSKGSAGKDGQDGGSGGKGGQLMLHALNEDYPVRLTAPGGSGGAGGKGGTGGTTFVWVFTKPPGNSKNPKPERPGRGGDVQIQNQKNQSAIKGRQEKDGQNGKRGKNGLRGKENVKVLSEKQFEEAVHNHYHQDWEKLTRTGWQILFNKN